MESNQRTHCWYTMLTDRVQFVGGQVELRPLHKGLPLLGMSSTSASLRSLCLTMGRHYNSNSSSSSRRRPMWHLRFVVVRYGLGQVRCIRFEIAYVRLSGLVTSRLLDRLIAMVGNGIRGTVVGPPRPQFGPPSGSWSSLCSSGSSSLQLWRY